MPLPLAFGNPGVGKKLSSIHEDDEESDADDVSLAILRSESRVTSTSARSISRSLDDKARPQRQDAGGVGKTNDSPKLYEDSPKKSSQRTTNASSSAFTAKPSIEYAFLESDQRNDRASTSNVIPAYPSTLQFDTLISDLGELRQQQKDILQRVSSSQEDMRELYSLLAKKYDVDDTSKSLKMLVDGLKSLSEAVESSNAQHGESLLSLKVRLDVKVMTLSAKKG